MGEEKIMTESLLSGSSITLFGRIVEDLSIATSRDAPAETPRGIVSDLQEQLENRIGTKASPDKAQLARIYGFSYGGVYYEILRPTIYLVHGDGVPAPKVKQPGPDTEDTPFYDDLKAWAYDQSDHTIRLDYEAGRFEQVLLDLLGDESFAQPMHRVSGSRVAGSRVSGSRVSGSRVSGSRVSGSRVSGSRVDGD